MAIQSIKNRIKTNLDALVTDEVLGGATITDIKKDPLAADIPSFPHAFLMPPSVDSDVLDNRTLTRTYTFDVMVLFKPENFETTTELEEKIESILSEFDNDPELGGTSLGGLLPVSSSPEPFTHMGRSLIMVIVQIKAKELVSLSFA